MSGIHNSAERSDDFGHHEADAREVDDNPQHEQGNVEPRHADDAEGQPTDASVYGTKAFAVSSNKPLTSKFRGVCWNKKNKRWQAAINSSGKYLYLGSYDSEEEAARVFDKAAVRIRADKARLNYRFKDYVDEHGVVLPDPQVEALLLEACNPTKPRRQRTKTKGGDGANAGAGTDNFQDGSHPQSVAYSPPPQTDSASADIALQALARLCGPQDGSSLARGLPLSLQHAASNHLDSHRATLQLQQLLDGNHSLNRALLLGSHGHGGGGLGASQSVPLLASIYQQQQQHQQQQQQQRQNQLLFANMQQQAMQGQGHLLRPISLGGETLSANFLQDLVAASNAPLNLSAAAVAGARRPSGQGMPLGSSAGGGGRSQNDLFSIIKSHLPIGAALDSIIPSGASDNIVGVLYSSRDSDKTGAGVWNGRSLQSLGMYDSDKDAKQACNGALLIYQQVDQQQSHQGHQSHAQDRYQGQGAEGSGGGGAAMLKGLMAAASGLQRVGLKEEMPCIAPEGWQPDPTACDDSMQQAPAGGAPAMSAEVSDESGTGKKRRATPGSQGGGQGDLYQDPQGEGMTMAMQMSSGQGPSPGGQGPAKRPRLPGMPMGMATDLNTLQQLASIDVREALHMFIMGKQQG